MENRNSHRTQNQKDDPYRDTTKPRGTQKCTECSAITVRGRWVRPPEKTRSEGELVPHSRGAKLLLARRKAPKSKAQIASSTTGPVHETMCPACRQIKDGYALGVVKIEGEHWKEKNDLVQETILNTERIARERNDQHRIIKFENVRGTMRVLVTMPELARHIGRELSRAFKGNVQYEGGQDEEFLYVTWNSDEENQEQPRLRHKPRSKARRRRGDRGALHKSKRLSTRAA